ncbi:MAG: hypothetical protein ACI8WT_003064 [Clostridium sp.]|jgi:hypothetical protein
MLNLYMNDNMDDIFNNMIYEVSEGLIVVDQHVVIKYYKNKV